MAVLIIFLSTHIRLGEAGLGCNPWPDCYAQFPFIDNVKGLAIPENKFGLFRSFHRSIASLLGLNVLAVFVMALWRRKQVSLFLPLLMLTIVIFLSALGIATPTRSFPIVTMGNILGGIALAGIGWAHFLQTKRKHAGLTLKLRFLLLALIIQIASGAWASANYTGAACSGLFNCSETTDVYGKMIHSFNPLRQLSLNTTYQPVPDTSSSIIQMTHRLLAVIWLVLVIYYYKKIRHRQKTLEKPARVIVVLTLAEFALGLGNVLFAMPLWPNTMHNLLALGLLFAVINLASRTMEIQNY